MLAAANGEPGASELPDLFISYPKTVMALPDDSILVDYRDYFSQEELSAFLPAFLEEGTVNDRLVVLPVAKSTEIMFINQTIFDRFSQATGVTIRLRIWIHGRGFTGLRRSTRTGPTTRRRIFRGMPNPCSFTTTTSTTSR